jgi:transcriptional regulator with XRE-family HTH domain
MFALRTSHDASAATTLLLSNTGQGPSGPEKEPGVPELGSPNVRRRQLAAELRRLRERAGFLGEEAAGRLGWSASKISRLERGQTGVKDTDLPLLLDLYRVDQPHREELMALAQESHRTGRRGAIGARFPAEHAKFLSVEAEAESVWDWEPQIVPGLLQTEDYARAVMLGWQTMFTVPPSEVESRVEARRLRQEVLHRDPPLQLSVVMDESVLYRQLGEAPVMRAQLEHIIEVSRLPHVKARILPLKGRHPVTAGAFTYTKFRPLHDIPVNDLVTFEYLTGTDQIDTQDDTYEYYIAFQALEEISLRLDQSTDELARVAREVWA